MFLFWRKRGDGGKLSSQCGVDEIRAPKVAATCEMFGCVKSPQGAHRNPTGCPQGAHKEPTGGPQGVRQETQGAHKEPSAGVASPPPATTL